MDARPDFYSQVPYTRFVLVPPGTAFRILWLIAGLATGYLASMFHLPSIGLLVLLAALAGASSNWSA